MKNYWREYLFNVLVIKILFIGLWGLCQNQRKGGVSIWFCFQVVLQGVSEHLAT